MKPTVLNIRFSGSLLKMMSFDDYEFVDRSTPFGNPFAISGPKTREKCINEYRKWIYKPEQHWLRSQMVAELAGKHLVCWCAPLPCHAEIIMDIANGGAE